MNERDNLDKQLMALKCGPFWMVDKAIRMIYDIYTALWLAEIFSRWTYLGNKNKLTKDGYFVFPQTAMQLATGIKPGKQTSIINQLKKDGIISVKRIGIPPRNYYKINLSNLAQMIDDWWEAEGRELDEKIKKIVTGPSYHKPDSCLSSDEEEVPDLTEKRPNPPETKNKIFTKRRFKTSSDKAINSNNTVSNNKESNNYSSEEIKISSEEGVSGKHCPLPDLKPPVSQNKEDPRKRPPKVLPATRDRLPWCRASEEARHLVEYWNSLPHTPTHRTNTKTIEQALAYLSRDILNKDSPQFVKQIMDRYEEILNDSVHYACPKVGLLEFLKGNSFRNNGKVPLYQKLKTPQGWKQLLKGQKAEKEKLTELLKSRYCKHILAEPDGVDFSPKQEALFRQGARYMSEYMRKKRLEKYIDGADELDYVLVVLRALSWQYGVENITVGHIGSRNTYNNVLPRYLSMNYEQAIH